MVEQDKNTQQADGVAKTLRTVGPGPVGDAMLRLGIRDFLASPELRPIYCPDTIAGPAVTLRMIPTRGRKAAGARHIDVMYEAAPGSVVVMDTFRRHDVIVFGGRAALIGRMHELEAVVIDGAMRDVAEIAEVGLPVFACAVPASTVRVSEVLETQAINVPVACGGVLVNPGDYIVANQDGLVVVPAEHVAEVAELARQIDDEDKRQLEKIRRGLPREQWYR